MKDFDLVKQSDEIGIDKGTLLSLYYIYIDQTEKDLITLKKLVERQDRSEVRSMAHHIKGASLNLEINNLVEVARSIEKFCDEQASWENIDESCRSLSAHFSHLKIRLAEAEADE